MSDKIIGELLNRGWYTACMIGDTRIMAHIRMSGFYTAWDAAKIAGLV